MMFTGLVQNANDPSYYPAPAAPTPAPSSPPTGRRGPGWGAVAGMVLGGMVLSSALTIGGVAAVDALGEDDGPSTSAAAPQDGTASEPSEAESDEALEATSEGWENVAGIITSSTVAIRVETARGTSEGTGVIYRENGTIITNNHVVDGAQSVLVSLHDGRIYSADVIGTDPSTDLAVIRLQSAPADLQSATLGDSDEVTVGEGVMAVGTPLGLQGTVTTGIISAVNRPVATQGEEEDGSDAAYTSALQTDASINPGNSGGPLVDASGEVIGINSSIAALASDSSQTAGSIGLGFAIPSNTVRLIADQLIASGEARHALLGVIARDGEQSAGEATYQGAEVQEITPGSGAEQAGLREGDLITALDDVAVPSASGLTGIVRSLEVGSSHTLTIVREGQETQLQVTLTEAG